MNDELISLLKKSLEVHRKSISGYTSVEEIELMDQVEEFIKNNSFYK